MTARSLLIAPLAALLVGCSAAAPLASSTRPVTGTASPPAAGTGCVSDAMARQVWTDVDKRLNAVAIDPNHAGLTDVATGAALIQLQQYIADTLVAKNLTEREVDTLNSLTVDDPGCNNGALQVTVRMTLTTDDYLRPDGTVDHADAAVGTQSHLQETFERAGGTWKQSGITDLDAPSPSPSAQVV